MNYLINIEIAESKFGILGIRLQKNMFDLVLSTFEKLLHHNTDHHTFYSPIYLVWITLI